METNKKEAVVLIHGVWMKGLELLYLRYKLWRHGYKVYQFRYSSLFKAPAENAEKLYQFISKIDASVIHIVAHSLGGIVVDHLFHNYEIKQSGNVVMIGTPINGSAVAVYLNQKKYLKYLLGKSIVNGLLGDAPEWNYKRKVCIIAGSKSLGVGQLLAHKVMRQVNDGTVNLDETCLKRADESHQLAQSHFSLLFSNELVKIVLLFLSKK